MPFSKKKQIFGNLNLFLKMKYVYPIVLLLLLASCQKEKKKIDHSKTDWAFYELKGNVESVSEKSFEAVNGTMEKGAPKRENNHDSDLQFNDEGQLISEKKWIKGNTPYEETTYLGREHAINKIQYMNGTPIIKTEHAWDKTKKLNTSVTKRNADNSQLSREEKIYKNSYMVEKNQYNTQNILTDKIQYDVDTKGNVLRENLYLNKETIQYITAYEYDSKNRKTLETSTDNNTGKLIYKTVFQYEGDHLISVETFNGKDNSLASSQKYSYDEKGNLLKEYTLDGNTKEEIVDQYVYDAKGNKTERVYTKNGQPLVKMTYAYDAKGSLAEEATYDEVNKTTYTRSYAYTYDEKGNWTQKVVKIDKKPSFIVERKITYLD